MSKMTNEQARASIILGLRKIQVAFSIAQPPEQDYIDGLLDFLHSRQWKARAEFFPACEILITDSEYAKNAQFGKYPAFADFERVRKKQNIGAQNDFRENLAFALRADNWWFHDDFLTMCAPDQRRAVDASGGISELFRRANDENHPTAISRLVDEVFENLAQVQDGIEYAAITDRTGGMVAIGTIIRPAITQEAR